MKGRKRKPTVIHKKEGTTNVTRHRNIKTVPSINVNDILPPVELIGDELIEFLKYAKILGEFGVVTKMDIPMLVQLAKVEVVCNKLEKMFTDKWEVTYSKGNGVVTGLNPALNKWEHFTLLKIKLLGNFGMSPVDRARVMIDKGKNADKENFTSLRKRSEMKIVDLKKKAV